MGEATMKKMVYTNKIDDVIVFHENNMLALYLDKIREYMPLFEKSGYSLKVGLMWKCFPRDTVILQRERFQNGYQCYVYCVVQKDGNEVRIGSIDGEADYYSLSTAWMISAMFRDLLKLNVTLYEKMSDVAAELNDFLSKCKSIEEGAQENTSNASPCPSKNPDEGETT